MNDSKKGWIIAIVVSSLSAIALGVLIYFQHESLDERRAEAEALKASVDRDGEMIKGTPDLVKKVIIQRETDTVIKEILSDEEDVNNLVRTLYSIAEETGVSITSLKPRRGSGRATRQDFEQVGYTLNFEAEGFQLMSFLDRIESHARLMSVMAFKVQAAGRTDYDADTEPHHRVQLDLETYVYRTGTAKMANIDRYEQKRDLLVSEISRRTAELRIQPYDYQGQRGRRDPWIDPRVAVEKDGLPTLSIEEQFTIVDELIQRTEEAEALVEGLRSAETVIESMKARAALEESLSFLDEEIRRVRSQGLLVFVSAAKRFESQVVDVVDRLREDVLNRSGDQGPSLASLKQAISGMESHIATQEYEVALDVFATVEPGLSLAERDEPKVAFVKALRDLHALTTTVLDFEAISLSIEGVAIYEDYRPVALINGQPISEGELVEGELVVRNITPDQIEFSYRGLIIARPLEDPAY